MQFKRHDAKLLSGKVPFFITGLPRTRTAWLANLFTTDTTVCFHEPRESIEAIVAAYPELRIGVADSTLPMKYPGLREKWPQARWLYVKRNPADAMRSFVKFTRNHYRLLNREIHRYWEMHHTASLGLGGEKGLDLMGIRFEDLSDPARIAQVWEFLLPDVPFNPLRLQVLENLKIEQDIERRINEVSKWQ